MHKACPPAELAPREALCLKTSPPVAVFPAGDGGSRTPPARTKVQSPDRTGRDDALPAKLPVRTREVSLIDGCV